MTKCSVCGGEGIVNIDKLETGWLRASADDFEKCEHCKGTGVEPVRE